MWWCFILTSKALSANKSKTILTALLDTDPCNHLQPTPKNPFMHKKGDLQISLFHTVQQHVDQIFIVPEREGVINHTVLRDPLENRGKVPQQRFVKVKRKRQRGNRSVERRCSPTTLGHSGFFSLATLDDDDIKCAVQGSSIHLRASEFFSFCRWIPNWISSDPRAVNSELGCPDFCSRTAASMHFSGTCWWRVQRFGTWT